MEPTDSPTGRRVEELLLATAAVGDAGLEPETVALLSAADRSEHVSSLIRPALQRGEAVVCDRFTLTSLALHGGGRGADVERIRAVNAWSTAGLSPDLTIVVDTDDVDDTLQETESGAWLAGAPDDLDEAAARLTLLTEARNDPERFVVCRAEESDTLPSAVVERLRRLVETRGALVTGPTSAAVEAQTLDGAAPGAGAEPPTPDAAQMSEPSPR